MTMFESESILHEYTQDDGIFYSEHQNVVVEDVSHVT